MCLTSLSDAYWEINGVTGNRNIVALQMERSPSLFTSWVCCLPMVHGTHLEIRGTTWQSDWKNLSHTDKPSSRIPHCQSKTRKQIYIFTLTLTWKRSHCGWQYRRQRPCWARLHPGILISHLQSGEILNVFRPELFSVVKKRNVNDNKPMWPDICMRKWAIRLHR